MEIIIEWFRVRADKIHLLWWSGRHYSGFIEHKDVGNVNCEQIVDISYRCEAEIASPRHIITWQSRNYSSDEN